MARTIQNDIIMSTILGVNPHIVSERKFARNLSVSTTEEDVWEAGGSYTYLPAGTAATANVVSNNAADTAAGTGARTVKVFGLDEFYRLQSEEVTLNGLTNVLTVRAYHRLYRMKVITAGSGETAAGTITITSTAAGTPLQAQINNGINITLMSQYTIPAGFTAYVFDLVIGVEGTKQATIFMRHRPVGEVFTAGHVHPAAAGLVELNLRDSFSEKTDIKVTAKTNTGTTDVAVNYTIFLIENGSLNL